LMKKIPNHLVELRLLDLKISKLVLVNLLEIIEEKCFI
jgi:hypothetical protein